MTRGDVITKVRELLGEAPEITVRPTERDYRPNDVEVAMRVVHHLIEMSTSKDLTETGNVNH